MFNSDGQRKDFPLKEGSLTIGRKNTCGLRIPLSSVSREHFRIEQEGQTLTLRDLGSSNGTFYNDERVQEAELQPGDQIRVGPVTFIVSINGQPEDIEPVRTVLPASASGEVESAEPGEPANSPAAEAAVEPAPAEPASSEANAPATAASEPQGEQPAAHAQHAKPDKPAKPKAIEPADEMPATAEDESRTPTADFDEDDPEDPIAALEALAAASDDEDDDEPIPFTEDEDEDEQEQPGQRQRSQ